VKIREQAPSQNYSKKGRHMRGNKGVLRIRGKIEKDREDCKERKMI
jgi:hypothetical protein